MRILTCFLFLQLLAGCQPAKKVPPINERESAREPKQTFPQTDGLRTNEDQRQDDFQNQTALKLVPFGGQYADSDYGTYCIEEYSEGMVDFAKSSCESNSYCTWVSSCPTEAISVGCPTKSSMQVTWYYKESNPQSCDEPLVKSKPEAVVYLSPTVFEDAGLQQGNKSLYDQYVFATLLQDKSVRLHNISAGDASSHDVLLKKGSKYFVGSGLGSEPNIRVVSDFGVHSIEVSSSEIELSAPFDRYGAETDVVALKDMQAYSNSSMAQSACTIEQGQVFRGDWSLRLLDLQRIEVAHELFENLCGQRTVFVKKSFFQRLVRVKE